MLAALWGCGRQSDNGKYEVELVKPDKILWKCGGQEYSYSGNDAYYEKLFHLAYRNWRRLEQSHGQPETAAACLEEEKDSKEPVVQFYYENGALYLDGKECWLTFFGKETDYVRLSDEKNTDQGGYIFLMKYSEEFRNLIREGMVSN